MGPEHSRSTSLAKSIWMPKQISFNIILGHRQSAGRKHIPKDPSQATATNKHGSKKQHSISVHLMLGSTRYYGIEHVARLFRTKPTHTHTPSAVAELESRPGQRVPPLDKQLIGKMWQLTTVQLREPNFPETVVLGDLRCRSEAWSMSALYKRAVLDASQLQDRTIAVNENNPNCSQCDGDLR